jgi:hypothetical protein
MKIFQPFKIPRIVKIDVFYVKASSLLKEISRAAEANYNCSFEVLNVDKLKIHSTLY